MKVCHVCGAEWTDETEFCPDCGADLTAATATATDLPEPEEVVLTHPALAVSCEDVVNAEIFRDLLRQHNIPFTCDTAESGGNMRVLFGGGFTAEDIYVEEENVAAAQALYDEVLASEPGFEEESDDF